MVDTRLVLAAALNELSASVRENTQVLQQLAAAMRPPAPRVEQLPHGRVAELLDGRPDAATVEP